MSRIALLVAWTVVAVAMSGCFADDEKEPPGAIDDGSTPDEATPEPDEPRQQPAPTPSEPSGEPAEPPAEPAPEEGNESAPPQANFAWPALADATIRPGVSLTYDGSQCTSNFVFSSPDNQTLYIGTAAHCFGDGAATETNGCETATAAPGGAVNVKGATQPGVLVYTSWSAMQEAGDASDAACRHNDFALIQLHPDDRQLVHPAMLHFGGPVGAAGAPSVGIGDKVLTFGNTGLRPGPAVLDQREGYVFSSSGDWSHGVYTVTPGIPGDSGSGVLLSDGRALGVLVTVGLVPYPASNEVTNLQTAMAYAAESGMEVRLATWPLLDSGLLPGV